MSEHESSMIGVYGRWAAGIVSDPPLLSFRSDRFTAETVDGWRREAMSKARELVAAPPRPDTPEVSVQDSYERGGLRVDELAWTLPYGPPTEALYIRPVRPSGRLPAVLALHDHSAFKFFGKEKIAEGRGPLHPLLIEHRQHYYGGRSWANELARQGFAVLVHDVFPFGSRRIAEGDVDPVIRSRADGREPRSIEEIIAYNRWAAEHESIVAKSLFSAGTTWPGTYLVEDQAALDVLSNRDEVDELRIGCCGLSGGGMRTAYLSGIDARIRAAVCVGFMTTWRDFLLHTSYTHTWMVYTPLLARYLDFPELAALRVPLPFFVQNNSEDELFTQGEVRRAEGILEEIYGKAGGADALRVEYYPGPHKFDERMQGEAFSWLAERLAE